MKDQVGVSRFVRGKAVVVWRVRRRAAATVRREELRARYGIVTSVCA